MDGDVAVRSSIDIDRLTNVMSLASYKFHSKADERARLAGARVESEIALRTAWVAQIEREINSEMKHLGIAAVSIDMTDEELLAELGA